MAFIVISCRSAGEIPAEGVLAEAGRRRHAEGLGIERQLEGDAVEQTEDDRGRLDGRDAPETSSADALGDRHPDQPAHACVQSGADRTAGEATDGRADDLLAPQRGHADLRAHQSPSTAYTWLHSATWRITDLDHASAIFRTSAAAWPFLERNGLIISVVWLDEGNHVPEG